MMIGSFLFKQKARDALKGNWQTALLVTFFAGILTTIYQVLQSLVFAEAQNVMLDLSYLLEQLAADQTITITQRLQVAELYEKWIQAVRAIPSGTWILLIALGVAALLLTPALLLSRDNYFLNRIRGEEIGLWEGLFGRMPSAVKAFWLNLRISVQVFLWSLLFIVPGIIAAVRYSQAMYFLAEDPSLSAGAAIRRSKEVMKGKKMSYVMLVISFLIWSLFVSSSQLFLASLMGKVAAMVIAQFLSLWVSTYMNASCAAFHFACASDNGIDELMSDLRLRMSSMGMSEEDLNKTFGVPGNEDKESESQDDENKGE